MTKHGKKYTAAAAKVELDKVYSAREAVALAKETSITKFDATVEVHMRTSLDSRQASTGKVLRRAGRSRFPGMCWAAMSPSHSRRRSRLPNRSAG